MKMHFPNNAAYHCESSRLKAQEGSQGIIGIILFAQKKLAEIVYIDLPRPGSSVFPENPPGTTESHKAVSDLIVPVSEAVLDINSISFDPLPLVNKSLYEESWIMHIHLKGAGNGTSVRRR